MRRVNKVFLLCFPFLLLVALSVLSVSLQTIKKTEDSGCGCNVEQATGEFDPEERVAYFLNQMIPAPLAILPELSSQAVLGEVSDGEKWIEVDLSDQKLTAWEGQNKYFETLVSSGKTGRTPTGEFQIWSKFKYTKMSGGSKENGTYYYLPNVPYTMYFYNSYGLHGTYWHNNFGVPMSHGCVNLPTVMAEKLFYWTTPTLPEGKTSVIASRDNLGTRVIIHE